MEEKKNVKISLTGLLLIFAIIVIVILSFLLYKVYSDKQVSNEKVGKLDSELSNLNEKVNGVIEENQEKKFVEEEKKDLPEKTVKDEKLSDNVSELPKASDSTNENIVLYNGCEIKIETGTQDISDMKNTNETNQKYNKIYYNYENGNYEGTSNGEFGEETYEGYSVVSNVKRIAMTQKYNAIPRKFSRINKLPEELMDMADYSSVTINSIDLDNDGKEEKIVCYTVSYEKGEIGDGEPRASSGIMLFDSNYNKIADLVSLEDGFWAGIKEEDRKIFLSLDKTEYVDIDNDNIMEIIIEVPTYEGTRISIIKYNNGNIEGETNLKVSVLP